MQGVKVPQVIGFIGAFCLSHSTRGYTFLSLVNECLSTPTPPPPLLQDYQSNSRCCFRNFGTMSYFAIYKYAPLSEQRQVLFPSNFEILVLLSQRGG